MVLGLEPRLATGMQQVAGHCLLTIAGAPPGLLGPSALQTAVLGAWRLKPAIMGRQAVLHGVQWRA